MWGKDAAPEMIHLLLLLTHIVHSLLDNDTSAHTINGCDMFSLTHFISEKQWVELDD
jgi:hypothetical protein